MASINRTVYPQLAEPKDNAEWRARYDLADDEVWLAKRQARGGERTLAFLLLLKTFQNVGYFVDIDAIPQRISDYIRNQLLENFPTQDPPISEPARLSKPTLYEYRVAIRQYRGVTAFGDSAREGLTTELTQAAQTMNSTADLINVEVEWLIKERWELPAFSTLDRLAGHIKQTVNDALFERVYVAMTGEQKAICRQMLRQPSDGGGAEWTRLKTLPSNPTPRHMQELNEHFQWLMTLGDIKKPLASVPAAKIMHFASEALSLPPSELGSGGMRMTKRYTFVLCAIHRARVETRDALGDMLRKRVAMMTADAQEDLNEMRESLRSVNENIVSMMFDVTISAETHASDNAALGADVQTILSDNDGWEEIRDKCKSLMTLHNSNFLPFLERHFRNNRRKLFDGIDLLELVSTSEDNASLRLIRYVNAHRDDIARTVSLDDDVGDLNWAPTNWLRFVQVDDDTADTADPSDRTQGAGSTQQYYRNRLEILAVWTLADELGTGDIAIVDSEQYADYRTQLLSDAECEQKLAAYCLATGLPMNGVDFVNQYREQLVKSWDAANAYIDRHPFKMDKDERPKLPKAPGKSFSHSHKGLRSKITARLAQRTLLQILCEADQTVKFTRHFGLPSGADPKLKQPKARYISTLFCYGTNLRPAQTARHMRGGFTDDDFIYIDRRHMRVENLERASFDLTSGTTHFILSRLWGTGKRMAGDGTHMPTWSKNLVGEMHIRYGAYGGIAYHFVGDTYTVLLSTFITCGTWEAVYILDAFMKNTSQIKPNIIHADTQGQSLPVFGLSDLMGVKLMPRIRNWKDKLFYLPHRNAETGSLKTLVGGVIDWDLMGAHYKDFMKVVLSIQAGKILPSTLLRILTSYSSKNKLYVAFRELGRVIRTNFLLRYITDVPLRATITATTNKAESFNALADWLFYGGKGIIAHNDPDDQEKCMKYLDVVANALILSNTAQITRILGQLNTEGVSVKKADVALLSPYLTEHVLRFGEFVIDPDEVFANLLENTALPDQIMNQIDWTPPN